MFKKCSYICVYLNFFIADTQIEKTYQIEIKFLVSICHHKKVDMKIEITMN